MEALKECAELSGDAGAWAAITLIRRGYKQYVPRAAKVYDPNPMELGSYPPTIRYTGPRKVLAMHLNTIFSNMASTAGVPTPQGGFPHADSHSSSSLVLDWWKTYGPQMVAGDPWLDELSRLKVD